MTSSQMPPQPSPEGLPAPDPFKQAPDIRTRAFEEGSLNPDGSVNNPNLLSPDDFATLRLLGVEVEEVPEEATTPAPSEPIPSASSAETRHENFRRLVEAASNTVFVEGTNLPMDSKDRQFLIDHPEFPIPTWESTRDPKEHLAPLNIADRARQRFWGAAVDAYEVFNDTRKNESILNKKAMEKLNELQSTGDDSQIRALFAVEASPGVFVNLYDGSHVEAALVREARKFFGENHHDFQAAWWYELINKAQNEGDFTKAMNRGLEIMNEAMTRGKYSMKGPRWTEGQVMGTLKGLEFMGKSQHLSFKHANVVWNRQGQLEYVGIKGADLMRELTGKFQGYAVGGLSGVDASNLAILAESALHTSIDYARLPVGDPNRPSEKEKVQAQFVLQRFAKQISDMRMGVMGQAEGASDEEQAQRERAQREFAEQQALREGGPLAPRRDVYVDMRTGKLVMPPAERIRTGGAAITGAIWEQIAVYSDIAVAIFPNLKYMSRDEMSPVDKVIERDFDEYLSSGEATPINGETEAQVEERRAMKKRQIARQAVGLSPHKYKGITQTEDEKGNEIPELAIRKKRRKLNTAAQKQRRREFKGK